MKQDVEKLVLANFNRFHQTEHSLDSWVIHSRDKCKMNVVYQLVCAKYRLVFGDFILPARCDVKLAGLSQKALKVIC